MGILDKITNSKVKSKRITSKILDRYNYQVTNSIKSYKTAYNRATNNFRVSLYKMYNDVLRDNHLSGLIELRKERVLGTDFHIYDKNGNISKDEEKFNSKWFYEFMRYALDEIYWGFSLIQIDGIYDNNILKITQVPHVNVDISEGCIIPDIYSEQEKESYLTKTYYKWLIEVVDNRDNLGVIADLIPLVLWKRSTMSAWAEYSEIFGTPIRIGKTSSNIEADRERLAMFLKGMGKSPWAVISEEESIEFVETSHTDAYNIYEKYIELINKEISKRIIGATEITDSNAGSGYAQSSVHNLQFGTKIQSDLRHLQFIIKDKLIPKMVQLGVLSEAVVFKFDTYEKLSLDKQIIIDKTLNDITPLDQQYLSDKYRVKFK